MRYAGGEDGSRTRLDCFAGHIRTIEIRDLAENRTFHHMSSLNIEHFRRSNECPVDLLSLDMAMIHPTVVTELSMRYATSAASAHTRR